MEYRDPPTVTGERMETVDLVGLLALTQCFRASMLRDSLPRRGINPVLNNTVQRLHAVDQSSGKPMSKTSVGLAAGKLTNIGS